MCGIAGIVDWGAGFGREKLAAIALAMRDTMVHRGPDDAGVWVDDAGICALAHRRLSIIDLRPEGRQPMGGLGTPVEVTFNGEIYNYRALRDEFAARGVAFRTETDTELLPQLFSDMDPAACQRLDGMYAMGLWHPERRRLLLARDPFGKKPLYIAEGRGWFAFASELQALLRVPGFDAAIDRDALGLYLLLQYVPAPWTIYRGARKLEPGSHLSLEWRDGGRSPLLTRGRVAAFQVAPSELGARPSSFEDKVDALGRLVTVAVEKRLVSDVPLGAFLSGGVDSSLVAAIATRELGRPLQTFAIGFADTDQTEHQFARQVATLLGTDHREELIRPDAVAMVHDIAARLDEPNGDSSCLPTLALCRHARRHVTVALSGDGGDELFGGYTRYVDTMAEAGNFFQRVARSARERRWFAPADAYLSPRWLTHQPEEVATLLGGLPAPVAAAVNGWRADLNATQLPLLHRLRTLDVETYLPGAVLAKVDRMSMQTSLEVRCPLLDRDVAAFAERLSVDDCVRLPGETKRLLKALTMRYLPREIVERRKMGFGLPANTWSHTRMIELVNDAIGSPGSRLGSLLDGAALRAWREHQSHPQRFSIYKAWPLLILELWLARAAAQPGVGQTLP